MFIRTVKIKKPKVWLAVFMAALVLGMGALLFFNLKNGGRVRELNSETKRQAFLAEMGWKVPDKFEEVKTVLIPEEWEEVYLSYNKMQKQQGFDLTAYKGMQVQVYTYRVLNYPEHENESNILCHLMVCGDQLIGGDVCSTAMDGFMQGLKKS